VRTAAVGASKIPTLCRADTETDALSDSGTYDVDEHDNVAVVDARRQIDKLFGVLSNVSSVTSVTSNATADTRVNHRGTANVKVAHTRSPNVGFRS